MGKLLQYMTWQEAKEYFKKVKFAIIPVGSTEQHGPHLPLGTDYLIAEHLSKKVAEKVDVVVTPPIPVGFAHYHTSFEGTLYVEPEVLASYYKGITDSLELYGVTHFLFINGHAGNMESMKAACRHLRIHGKTGASFNWFYNAGKLNKDWALIAHGDIIETSVMMAIAPDSVHLDRAKVPVNKKLTDKLQTNGGPPVQFGPAIVDFYLMMKDITDSGDMFEYDHYPNADFSTDPSKATAELGEKVIAGVVDYLADFCKEFVKVKFEPVK